MAVTAQQSRPLLPQGVGRFTPAWRLFFLAMFLIAGFGLFAYWRETSQGMVVTGMRNVGTQGGATWGLYISMVVYFVGVSFAGITVAALIRSFDLKSLRLCARALMTTRVLRHRPYHGVQMAPKSLLLHTYFDAAIADGGMHCKFEETCRPVYRS